MARGRAAEREQQALDAQRAQAEMAERVARLEQALATEASAAEAAVASGQDTTAAVASTVAAAQFR